MSWRASMADKMAPSLGKPVVIENVSGAGGNIACDKVAKSAPDGYTLVMCGNGSLISAPALFDKIPYDPVKDFAPISQIFVSNNILVVHPDVPAKSLAELVALAKAKPGELTYGHTGPAPRSILPANCSSRWRRSISARSPIAARPRSCPTCWRAASRSAFMNVVNVRRW